MGSTFSRRLAALVLPLILGLAAPFSADSARAATRPPDEQAQVLAKLAAHDECTRGWLAAGGGDAQGTMAHFEAALRLDPAHAGAAMSLGLARHLAGDSAAAVESFRQAIALDAEAYEPRIGLFFALYELDRLDEAREALHAALVVDFEHQNLAKASWKVHSLLGGDAAQTAEGYAARFQKNPKNALTLFLHANAMLELGDGDVATQEWSAALELDPKLAAAAFALSDQTATGSKEHLALLERVIALGLDGGTIQSFRGWDLQLLGRFDEAAAAYRKGIELGDRGGLARRNLGILCALQGRMDEAAGQFTALLRKRDECLLLWGTPTAPPEEAIGHWKSVVERTPDQWPAWMLLGNSYGMAGDWESALACQRKAVELGDDRALAHLGLALALERTDLAAAARELERATALDPEMRCAQFELGALWIETQPKEAVARLDKALALAPRSVLIRTLRAKAELAAGNVDAAVEDCAQALRAALPSVATLKVAAACRARLGDAEGQLRDLTRALQLAPSDADAYFLRAKVSASLRDTASAVQDYYAAWIHAPQSDCGRASGNRLSELQALSPCQACSMSGQRMCPLCIGVGYKHCNYCNGSPRRYDGQTCTYCRFSGRPGYDKCTFCSGIGRRHCTTCFGIGQVLR